MTVPHISIPVKLLPGPRVPAVGSRVRRARQPGLRASRFRVAWIDVAIQVVGMALIAWAAWWVATSGVLLEGAGLFTGWYAEQIAPLLAVDLSLPGGAAIDSIFVTGDAGSMLKPPQGSP